MHLTLLDHSAVCSRLPLTWLTHSCHCVIIISYHRLLPIIADIVCRSHDGLSIDVEVAVQYSLNQNASDLWRLYMDLGTCNHSLSLLHLTYVIALRITPMIVRVYGNDGVTNHSI
jgi:hypothetical protein